MNSIELTNATLHLKDSLNFLIKIEFFNLYKRSKSGSLWLFGFTIFYLLLYLLPDTNNTIPVKGVFTVLIIIIWLGILIFIITVLSKYTNRRRWRDRVIAETFLHPEKFNFSWDDERLAYSTEKYETTMKWEMYKYYAEHKNTIYVFNERNIYEALFSPKSELGEEKYHNLKEIVSSRLTLLSTPKGG